MARYIDADKVHESIEALQIALESNNDRIWAKNKPYYKGLATARAVLDETPTADVAPRAEVAREIFEEIEKTINRKMDRNQRSYEELKSRESTLAIWGYKDMGYFQGIVTACDGFQELIDELKKKYTEDKNA